MPIDIPEYNLPSAIQEAYNNGMRAEPEPLIRQQQINRLLYQLRDEYNDYLATILFPKEAYKWGIFRITYPSFNVYRSVKLFNYLVTGTLQPCAPREINRGVEPEQAWRAHWLNLVEPLTFTQINTRQNRELFTQPLPNDPDEQQRYLMAVKAFRTYSTCYNDLERALTENYAFKAPQTKLWIPKTAVLYAPYIKLLKNESINPLAMETQILACTRSIRVNLADQPDELAYFESLHTHNLAVITARIAIQQAFKQVVLSRNITRAMIAVAVIGIMISGLGLGLVYFKAITVAITTSQFLLTLLATMLVVQGLGVSRTLFFNHHRANGNLPPLEVLNQYPLEETLRAEVHCRILSL